MRSIFRFFFLLLLLVVGGFAYLIYHRSGTVSLAFLEKSVPLITPPPESSNGVLPVGPDARTYSFSLSEEGVGLDEVVFRVEQGGKVQEVSRTRFDPGTLTVTVPVALNGKELGLKEGDASLRVSTFDKSFWNNGASITVPLLVDYTRPRLELLTNQHNTGLGGVELTFYRVKSPDVARSGVRVGALEFPGYRAELLDEGFAGLSDIYFAFFALPHDFSRDKDKVTVFVVDRAENSSAVALPFLVIPRRYKEVEMKLSDNFLRKAFEELLPRYFEETNAKEPLPDFDSLNDEEKRRLFKAINEDYRSIMLQRTASLLRKTEERKLWEAPWSRPMSAAPTSTFAETRRYSLNGVYTSTSLHAGVDLADVTNAPVRAVNNGTVLFADYLGLYGNTVIVDHGFGLATLYGHLSSIDVSVGDSVLRDAVIGKSGVTGLSGGDHLHFEFRLHGVPIHPIEWWDQSWIREHIDKKIQGVKEQLAAQMALDAAVKAPS